MLSNPPTDMTEPEFADFLRDPEERWELIGGEPVMMSPTPWPPCTVNCAGPDLERPA